jgi:chorismate mutase
MLENYRKEISDIDDELTKLFVRRLDVAGEIARYKQEHGLPVPDAAVERKKLRHITDSVRRSMRNMPPPSIRSFLS